MNFVEETSKKLERYLRIFQSRVKYFWVPKKVSNFHKVLSWRISCLFGEIFLEDIGNFSAKIF
jgi:hypothetical protein